jgi:signal peptidase II
MATENLVPMRDWKPIVGWLLLSGVVIAADQWTKWIVEAAIPFGTSIYVLPVMDLVHVRNTGAAFSFLAGASGWQREFFIGVGILASSWMLWMIARAERGQRAFCMALSLILGGALGNVIDRVRVGAVVDFLHFHWGPYYWPAFNVADSAITCGAILLIADAFWQGRKASRTNARTALE